MKRLAATCFAAACLLTATAVAAAGAYKWTDADGKVHYSDSPPPETARSVEQTNVPVRPVQPKGPDVARIAAASPVTLYAIPDCQTCDMARDYLKRRGVPFTETNVENDPQAQAAMKERVGALAVPTIIIGEKIMKGYVESVLAGELDEAGYPKAASAAPAAAGQAEAAPAASAEGTPEDAAAQAAAAGEEAPTAEATVTAGEAPPADDGQAPPPEEPAAPPAGTQGY